MQPRLNYSAVWRDMQQLLRGHVELLAAIAGVFIFLPALLQGHYLPVEQLPDNASQKVVMATLRAYLFAHWPWLMVTALLNTVGTLAIMAMMLQRGLTVGRAIMLGAAITPVYILANILTGMVVFLGFLLLIVPGIYIAVKLLLVGPVMVAEQERNPVQALVRAWRLTKNNSVLIFGFLLILFITALIIIAALQSLVGIVLALVLPDTAAAFGALLVESALGTVLAVLSAGCYCAIYRTLANVPAASPITLE